MSGAYMWCGAARRAKGGQSQPRDEPLSQQQQPQRRYPRGGVLSYALAMRCPVLAERMLVYGSTRLLRAARY
eukprot:2502594-Rhodomonas_salina.1